MDDRAASFFIAVGTVCEEASRAHLEVTVATGAGVRLTGIPAPPSRSDGRQLDDTGYADGLTVGGDGVELGDVVEVTLRHPRD